MPAPPTLWFDVTTSWHERGRPNGTLRVERPRGHEFVRDVVEAFPTDVTLVTYGKPTLEDVFIHLTGHRFWADGENPATDQG